MKFTLVSLSKNHNLFGGIDRYMQKFAAVVDECTDSQFKSNLEVLMNSEVVLSTGARSSVEEKLA